MELTFPTNLASSVGIMSSVGLFAGMFELQMALEELLSGEFDAALGTRERFSFLSGFNETFLDMAFLRRDFSTIVFKIRRFVIITFNVAALLINITVVIFFIVYHRVNIFITVTVLQGDLFIVQ